MPPTKMRLGMSVPYLGAARGVSSPPPGAAVGGGAAAILCISAGVVSRRKLGAPKGRMLRLLLEIGGARWPKRFFSLPFVGSSGSVSFLFFFSG